MRMPASAYDFDSVLSTSMFWWRGMKPTHDTGAKSTVRSVGPIREHSPRSHSCFHCLPNLIQRNFGFGLELNLLGYPGCLPAFGISCPLLR